MLGVLPTKKWKKNKNQDSGETKVISTYHVTYQIMSNGHMIKKQFIEASIH